MTGRLPAAITVGSALVLLGLAAGWFGLQIAPDTDGGHGARIFPLMASAAILLMGGLELRRGLAGDNTPIALSNSPSAILGLLALSVAYVFVVTKLGYLIATALAAPLAMWLFGMRSPLWLVVTALVCPVVYHLIFFELLGVFPPFGEWFDLLDIIQGY